LGESLLDAAPQKVGKLDLAKPKTEGADCGAIGDWGIFENFDKQYKS
jgi:hypothetical protein